MIELIQATIAKEQASQPIYLKPQYLSEAVTSDHLVMCAMLRATAYISCVSHTGGDTVSTALALQSKVFASNDLANGWQKSNSLWECPKALGG